MLLQHPRTAEQVCHSLSERLAHLECDAVISPALGGIIVGHEVGRALNKRHIFAEKEDGRLVLRRGFEDFRAGTLYRDRRRSDSRRSRTGNY